RSALAKPAPTVERPEAFGGRENKSVYHTCSRLAADRDSSGDSSPESPARFESSAPDESRETETTIGQPAGLNDSQPNNRNSFAERAIWDLNIANRQTRLLKPHHYLRHHLFDRHMRSVYRVRVFRCDQW